jgi:hypothetical protein
MAERPATLERARTQISQRLHERRGEIEAAIVSRVQAIADPKEAADPRYLQGLWAALRAALDFGIAAVEQGEERAPPIPPILPAQARMAARCGVGLEVVLRRYVAGYGLLSEFIVSEAEEAELIREVGLRQLMRGQAALFDRLVAAVSEEHARETAEQGSGSSDERRLERIQRLLAGELIDTETLGYDFEVDHVGIVATGLGAADAIRQSAAASGQRLLLTRPDEHTVWAWRGSNRRVDPQDIAPELGASLPAGVHLALGEIGGGFSGWRLTHRQARAALPIAVRAGEKVVRYSEVSLLASMLGDDLLISSLRELYLEPLGRKHDGGRTARETLRAYFAAGRNVASAAATLGITRQSAANRLRTIENTLGRSLAECANEVEGALSLEQLESRDLD